MNKLRNWSWMPALCAGIVLCCVDSLRADILNLPEFGILTASDGEVGDQFGYAICVKDGIALISAPYDDDNGTNTGSVYVFEEQEDGQWVETGKIYPDDPIVYSSFGHAIAEDNGIWVIGSFGLDNSSGVVYTFEHQKDSTWLQTSQLPDGGSPYFGTVVDISGETIVVGDWFNNSYNGDVYVYEFDGVDWNKVGRAGGC